jgi:hypothetical protein
MRGMKTSATAGTTHEQQVLRLARARKLLRARDLASSSAWRAGSTPSLA